MKKCTKCKIERELEEFSKAKANKDGLIGICKSCQKEYQKEYRQNNKEKTNKSYKDYYENNKQIINERNKEWRENNKEHTRKYQKEYNENNKEKIKEYNKDYRKKNKEHKKEYNREWRENNKEKIKKYNENNKEEIKQKRKQYREANKDKSKEYRKNNKESIKEHRQNYKERKNKLRRDKKKVDPLFKMTENLRSRTYQAFKKKCYTKNSKTKEMLGVDWEVCKAHIERQFIKGMSWDNSGEWHIDHIIPLASANTGEELKKLCHYSNLQPLWAFDNLMKSDKINGQQNKFRF